MFEVGGERFDQFLRTASVVSSSATGAAYGPLETSRQQLFFGRLPISRKAENPGTTTFVCPLFGWVKRDRCCCLGCQWSVARKRRPRWPGALLYGRAPGVASAFLRACEIFCLFLGRSEPYPQAGCRPGTARRSLPAPIRRESTACSRRISAAIPACGRRFFRISCSRPVALQLAI
jgi:hypothetical protein